MHDTIKKQFPPPLLAALRESRDWLSRASEWPAAVFHPARRESIRRLAALKDMHRGERCFIIGNGPSLKDTDVSRLRGEYTFGMNRVYLAFPEWGFATSYLVSVNTLVIEQCAAELLAQPMPVFLSWRSRNKVPGSRFQVPGRVSKLLFPASHVAVRQKESAPGTLHLEPGTLHPASTSKNPIYLHTTYTGPRFAPDARGRLWEGATVTYVCLQLAFHMGFRTAILVGVDHSFTSQGEPNTTVISAGDDPNHFSPGYFGAGFRWQLPDLDTSEIGYRMAREAYEKAGRKILDATIGGKLNVFEKTAFEALFHGGGIERA